MNRSRDWFDRVQHGNAFEGMPGTRWTRLKLAVRALLRRVLA